MTFDIEEWALAKAGGKGSPSKYAEYNSYLNTILDTLDERGVKSTFFCTGMMASDFPQIVKLIQSRGHEIGCHSNRHIWMNKMSVKEAREDTHVAIDSLEQCTGQKVCSYRAPAFSIGESNKWMFEILVDEGITRDSSIYPSVRDFGGFPAFKSNEPCVLIYKGVRLIEYPISLISFCGKSIAYSGGGYFRFFPFSFVQRCIAKSNYTMCYFHINDLLPETGGLPSREVYEAYYKEPGSFKNRYTRYLKNNIGKKNALAKLCKFIKTEDFINIEQAEKSIDWLIAPKVEIE